VSSGTASASRRTYRLYLPKEWAEDPERRARAGVPQEVGFATKPEIALMQIRALKAAGVPEGVVLMDAGYGVDTALREAIAALGLDYVAGVQSHMTVWPAGAGPLPPAPWSGRGRPPSRRRRAAGHRPTAIRALAFGLPAEAWATVTWREGAAGKLSSRFARLRVRPAHRDEGLKAPRPEEWLLIEWPEDEDEPTKYWLATLPEEVAFERLVDLAKLRWRIERDYQELKQELGLGHYEGRGWRGFHHHATLCIAAYGFLISERETIPPSGAGAAAKCEKPALPEGHRPRGAADPDRAARRQFDRNNPSAALGRARQSARPMCGAQLLGDLLGLVGLEIERQFDAVGLDVEPHHAERRRPDLQVGADLALPVDAHRPHSDQETPVMSLAWVGEFAQRPSMRASATPVLASWNRKPFT
jgi:hypothetical protein